MNDLLDNIEKQISYGANKLKPNEMKNLFIKKSALETFMTELYRKGSWKSVSIKWNTEFQN